MKGGTEGGRACVCVREREMETECVREIDMHSPVRIVRMPIKEGHHGLLNLSGDDPSFANNSARHSR